MGPSSSSLGPVLTSAIFIVFVVISSPVSPFFVRVIDGLYNKLETYHKLPQDYPDTDRGEPFWHKVIKLSVYNLAIILLATLSTILYIVISGEFGVGITFETAIGLALLILIMNFTIRVVSFGKWGDESGLERRKERLHEFGFSFILTIYFLFVFGVGLTIINGGIPSELGITGEINIIKGCIYSITLFLSPSVFSYASEKYLISGTEVPDDSKDEYSAN